MHRLEVPHARAGPRLHADDALGVEVVAQPVAAVRVVGRRGRRHVHVVELRVVRHAGPDVGVAGVLGRAVEPGLVARLVLLRHGVKRPQLASGAHVVGLDVARRQLPGPRVADGAAPGIRDRVADDDHVAGHKGSLGREVGAAPHVADAERQVDLAGLAECLIRPAGARVDRDQVGVVGADQEPFGVAVGPVRHAARQEAAVVGPADAVALRVVHPAPLARGGVERHDDAEAGDGVQRAVHHQRRVLVADAAEDGVVLEVEVGVARAPDDLELVDVVLRDLIHGRVLHAVRSAGVVSPLAVCEAWLRQRRRIQTKQHRRRAHRS